MTTSKKYIHVLLLLLLCSYCSTDAAAKHNISIVSCLPDQATSLLQLKRSFVDFDGKLTSWRAGRDCCHWEGITCDMASGRVVSLDLGGFNLDARHIDPALFNLTSVRNLSLAFNAFDGVYFPSYGFERLTDIVHLNFSNTQFSGQIPIGIARLKNLVTLDFTGNDKLYLQEPNFQTFMTNLSNLRELRLDDVDISSAGSTWSIVLANSVPQLQILSLEGCGLFGPVHPSFSRLRSLTTIRIGGNRGLTGKGLEYFTEFSSLSILDISLNNFEGDFPTKIFEIKSLRSLDLSGNFLSVCLPDFPVGNNLEALNLVGCNLSCDIPLSFTNLMSLKTLGLYTTEIFKWSSLISKLPSLNALQLYKRGSTTPVLSWIGNLKNLTYLLLNGYDFSQSAPSWIGNLTSLASLEIYNCKFSTPIPYQIGNLANLTSLVLFDWNNNGQPIPSWIGNLTKLTELRLIGCNFSGPIPSTIGNLTQLEFFFGSGNSLSGKIPKSLLALPALQILDLSTNQISGLEDASVLSSSPIYIISLRMNHLTGPIPESFFQLKHLERLDLSLNKFTSLEKSPSIVHMPYLSFLDLSSNRLQGTIPIPLTTTASLALGYSNNSFSSIVPNFGRYVRNIIYLDLSRNKLNGHVPTSICSSSQLNILDLSYNKFSGPIPLCLTESENLNVLKLRENQFHGTFPENITEGCKFETIDLNGNQIEGKLPRSLSNCQDLQLLDVGNNQITGSFPSWLGALPKLRVLVIKSNQLNGTIRDIKDDRSIDTHFRSLQILDLASNNFSGNLPKGWFNGLQAMMTTNDDKIQVLGYDTHSIGFYRDTITITFKGSDLIFTKILTAFTAIDFSNNSFDGRVPESVGGLVSLHGLNMSYNNFIGQIPLQLGNLSQLESLDLSWNKFSGEIPQELTSLTYLAFLNLSYNNLNGRIPQGNHFSTFLSNSFEGNAGLCGFQLSKQCDNQGSITPTAVAPSESDNLWQDKFGVVMLFLCVGLGFGVGFALSFLLRIFYRMEGWVCKPRIHM